MKKTNLNILPHCTLNFVHNVLNIFKEAIKHLESNATTATELNGIMVNIEETLRQRWADKFYGSNATKLLSLTKSISLTDKNLRKKLISFFNAVCHIYINGTIMNICFWARARA